MVKSTAGDALPGLAQVVQDDAEQAVQQLLLDFGDVALDGRRGSCRCRPAASRESGNTSEGLSSSTPLPSYGLQPERDHAGGRRQAVQKLRVGELLHADQVHRQVGAQVGREAGDQVAHEGIVQQVDGADLGLGDAVRPAEIELDRRGLALVVLHVLEDGVDFLLRKLSAHTPGSWQTYRRMRGKTFSRRRRHAAGNTAQQQIFLPPV